MIIKLSAKFTDGYGYGLLDKPTAEPSFKMYKIKGLNKDGDPLTVNIYANSELEAADNFELFYADCVMKEIELAKDLKK